MLVTAERCHDNGVWYSVNPICSQDIIYIFFLECLLYNRASALSAALRQSMPVHLSFCALFMKNQYSALEWGRKNENRRQWCQFRNRGFSWRTPKGHHDFRGPFYNQSFTNSPWKIWRGPQGSAPSLKPPARPRTLRSRFHAPDNISLLSSFVLLCAFNVLLLLSSREAIYMHISSNRRTSVSPCVINQWNWSAEFPPPDDRRDGGAKVDRAGTSALQSMERHWVGNCAFALCVCLARVSQQLLVACWQYANSNFNQSGRAI